MSLNAKLRTLVASVALVGIGTASVAVAQDRCQGNQRPFDGTIVFTEHVEFLASAQGICAARGTISGSGDITTLGKTAVASDDCIMPVPGTQTSHFSSTNLTFTVGGEILRATYRGQATATSWLPVPPYAPTELDIVGRVIFTGGEGRFANARGTAVVSGGETLNLNTGLYSGTITVSGCISGVR